jgi:hypothetical protein
MLYFFSRLHDGEHAGFGAKIVERLKAALSGITLVAPLWDVYEAYVHHELLMFKISKASPETMDISATDKSRDGTFREVRRLINFYATDADPAAKQAAIALQFVIRPYDDAADRNLFEETTFIRNCLADLNKPANAQNIAALPGLSALLTRLESLNNHLDDLYTQRLEALEEIKALGKRVDVRSDVDNALIEIFQAINALHRSNELGAKDPALKATLEQSAEFINALIDQLQKVLAHRGHHKPKDDGKEDGGTQTPITPPTPPTPPEAGTQNPNTDRPDASQTTQNPTDEPHHLDPNEHPAMGERKADEQKKKDEEGKK